MLYRKYFFNRALRILVITNAIILLAAGMIAPIYAIFIKEIGGDIMEAGAAGTIFAVVAGIATLFSAKLADRTEHKHKIISLGYFLMAVGFFLYIFVDSIWFLFAIQALIGLGEAIYSPAFDGLFSENVCKSKESREWGLWESTYYFSIAIGAILGAFIAKNFGFDALFMIMSLFCLGSAIYLYSTPVVKLKTHNK